MAVKDLPRRGHYVIRNTTALTMDAALGELADTDIEVKNGALVDIGSGLPAEGAVAIDGTNSITLPGFVDSH